VPQDNYHQQCQYDIRFPSPHGASPSTTMPTISRCCADLLSLRRDWWRWIERQDTSLIVRLQAIHITRCMVHDGRNRLPALVGMLQAQHMPQFVQEHAAHIQERGQLPMAEHGPAAAPHRHPSTALR
jgi:hypothetical protein